MHYRRPHYDVVSPGVLRNARRDNVGGVFMQLHRPPRESICLPGPSPLRRRFHLLGVLAASGLAGFGVWLIADDLVAAISTSLAVLPLLMSFFPAPTDASSVSLVKNTAPVVALATTDAVVIEPRFPGHWRTARAGRRFVERMRARGASRPPSAPASA